MGIFKSNYRGKFNLTADIISSIKSATTCIKVCSFLMQDREVKDILEKKARDIPVFILSNRSNDEIFEYCNDSPEEVKIQTHNLVELQLSGAHVRIANGLHAKFIIVDSHKGWLTSANMTANSLGKNVETGILLMNNELVELESIFDMIFTNAECKLDVLSGSIINNVQENYITKYTRKFPDSPLRITLASNHSNKAVSNDCMKFCDTKDLYEEILNIINSAEREIAIVTWHFNLFSRYAKNTYAPDYHSEQLTELLFALSKAVMKGVRVDIFSDPIGSDNSCKKSESSVRYLVDKIGCISYLVPSNHSKCVINESKGLILTGNIDVSHGMKNGFEVGCILDKQQYQEQKKLIDELKMIAI